MKRLFAGEVYEIIPQPNGIVFSYCRDIIEDSVIVRYKMYSFETEELSDVAKNIYQISKFGSCYRSAVSLCSNYISARTVQLTNGRVFVIESSGKAMLLDNESLPIWTGELLYKGNAPADIAFHRNAFWVCYPNSNVILRFNLSTMRQELRIGGNSSPFDSPCDLFVDGDDAYVSNKGSSKIIRLNLVTYTVSDYMEFTEAVYGYLKIKNKEFVLLKSGIYEL